MENKRNGAFAFWMKKYEPWKQKRYCGFDVE
jgi:hypothetical protein